LVQALIFNVALCSFSLVEKQDHPVAVLANQVSSQVVLSSPWDGTILSKNAARSLGHVAGALRSKRVETVGDIKASASFENIDWT
jgi:hypothetical protein